ncbi:MAG: PspA/IM30 family protein [Thermoleophilia bacterium]|nr:PspA/IM30 family protein [Thermoleophilia bacterium]
MGLFQRLSLIFKSKANKVLDAAEDPRETLDYSYEKQLEMLQQVRRGLADVATGKKRLDLQIEKLQQSSTKLDSQARAAMGSGREDLARTALERKAGIQAQIDSIALQRDQLQAEQDKLTMAEQKLTARVEAFRTQKETIKAQYTAAEAQARIGEAVSGIGEDMADVGMAMDRAQNKVETMRARAGAIDELLASGALDDLTGTGGDAIDQELAKIGAGAQVETELAALKAELGQGTAPSGQLPAGGTS